MRPAARSAALGGLRVPAGRRQANTQRSISTVVARSLFCFASHRRERA